MTATATREKQVGAQRRWRATDLPTLPCKDPARRRAAEGDVFTFLQTYFAERFYLTWTPNQREMIAAILRCAQHGGDQAIAAPRGDGKTTNAEAVTIYSILTGVLRFPMILAATGPDADRILANIKNELARNETLWEDYPEVCVPCRDVDGVPQRSGSQTMDGEPTRIRWSGNHIVFPMTECSLRAGEMGRSAGSVIMTRGLDASIRGIRIGALRPDFVLIDDGETRESAESDHQTAIRERKIEQDVAGLGGPGRKIGRLWLCTIMNTRCASQKFTDRKLKPSWNGKRYRLLEQNPDRGDLWEEYITKRQAGMERGDDLTGREAHAYYLTNRDELDAGALVSNRERFIRDILEDGSERESSALEHCYNIIADRGWEAFQTEYQNDPPEELGPQDSGLTAEKVRCRLNGLKRALVPENATVLTAALDVGKYYCHFCVIAWMPNAAGFVVDYGVQQVHGTKKHEAPERELLHALGSWREQLLADPYRTDSGKEKPLDFALIDSGNWDRVIYHFCNESGRPFRASKGFGQSTRNAPFSTGKPSKTVLIGEHWYASRQPTGIWLYGLNADYWKRWVHDRFLTPVGSPGSLSLWGDGEREHRAYSRHIVSETEQEQVVPGKGIVRKWVARTKDNDWLDATYMACAAASMCGIRLLKPTLPSVQQRRRTKSKPPAHLLSRDGGWVSR